METYSFLLIVAILASLIAINLELRLSSLNKAKRFFAMLSIVIVTVMISGGVAITGSIAMKDITSLENDISKIKQTQVSDPQIKKILSELPSQIDYNKDFEKIKELIIKLEERILVLNELNTGLEEENEDLQEDIEDLKDKLDDLNDKVSSIGVVVGVY